MKVLEFMREGINCPIYLNTFDKEFVKVDSSVLYEYGYLEGYYSDDLFNVLNEDGKVFIVVEDELTYLRKKRKEDLISIKRLHESLDYYRNALNKERQSVFDSIIYSFMPKGFKDLSKFNRTPLRRHIANTLFFLSKRGYVLAEDIESFMNRYKTRKTTRR